MSAQEKKLVIFVFILSAIALGNAGSTLYLPAMPIISDALHTTDGMMKSTLSIYLIAYGVSQLIYGPLSDAFGRKINLVVGLVIFIIGSIISAKSHQINILIFGRLIEGLGMGAANAVGYAMMQDIYKGSKLTLKLSYISVFVGFVPFVAPIFGGYLVDGIGWQACFYFLTAFAIILLIFKLKFLPETLGILDKSAIYPSVLYKRYKILFTNPLFMGYVLVTGISFASIFTVGGTLPFLIVNHLGISSSLCGWLAGVPALGYLSGSFLSGNLANKISLRRLILIGISFGLIGVFLGIFINYWVINFNLYTLILPLIILMFGFGVLVPIGSSGAMAVFPKLAGTASSVLCGLMFSFASTLTSISSYLKFFSPIPLFILLGFIFILVFFCLFLIKNGEKNS